MITREIKVFVRRLQSKPNGRACSLLFFFSFIQIFFWYSFSVLESVFSQEDKISLGYKNM